MACARCGGRMRLIALIDQPPVMRRVLGHLGLPTEVPEPRPARDPPLWDSGLPSHSSEAVAGFEFGA